MSDTKDNQHVSVMGSGKLYPLLPLRDIVIFPYMVTPLFVGRPRSIKALELAMEGDKSVFLTTQLDPKVDDPAVGDIYEIGTIGQVVQIVYQQVWLVIDGGAFQGTF